MALATIAPLTALVLVATLLPLSRGTAWWIRDFDFPRLQIATLALLTIVAQSIWLDMSAPVTWLLMTASIFCLVYQAWWIIPYTRPYPNEVKLHAGNPGADRIRVMTANVLSPNHNSDGLIALIREFEPDIFVTLESDAWWQERLDVLQPEYPYAIKCPLENLYGMHVYSKLRLEDSAVQFLVQPGIPSIHTAAVLKSGKRIRMHFLHPAPPSPTENMESRERDAELVMVAKSIAHLNTPVIVAGDLNDVAWSPTTRLFRKLSGLLDPRIGRGMFNTFHAGHWFLRWPLDHLFHSRHFTLSFIKRLPAFGSDHFPVVVELVYDEAEGIHEHGLAADAEDDKIAAEKLATANAEVTDVHEPSV